MLHIEDDGVKKLLLTGAFGLEKENLRVMENGHFSQSPHPFEGEKHIVKDFCENQLEINTPVYQTAEEAVGALHTYNKMVAGKLASLPEREYMWQFSNPPYIRNGDDIPIAEFGAGYEDKVKYREYLAAKYGKYKMTLCGIHVNYSFGEELLMQDFKLSGEPDFTVYKNRLYLDAAEQMALYGWLLVSVTAASPVTDSSYVEKKVFDRDEFLGMASVRCSELGYWNSFSPFFDYSDIGHYVDSIENYVKDGVLWAPSELYYPIRLKPPGENSLERMKKHGVNHIELRMFDLNPLCEEGVNVKDILFARLMLVWLVSRPRRPFSRKEQMQAVQNFKNAAHFDLKTVTITAPNGENYPVADYAIYVIDSMKEFYRKLQMDVSEILDFEYRKFEDAHNRYAWQVRKQYGSGFAKKALALAKERQEKLLEN